MKKKRLKLSALLLVCVLLASACLTACGTGESVETDSQRPKETEAYSADTSAGDTDKTPETEAETDAPDSFMRTDSAAHRISTAEYPEYVARPDGADYGEDYRAYEKAVDEWQKAKRERREIFGGMSEGFEGFLTRSLEAFVSNTNGRNRVVSPISVYLALGILADTADGESRAQVLSAIGADSIEEVRRTCSDIWDTMYRDDKTVSVLLNNSIWMSNLFEYNSSVTDSIAKAHRASSFTGDTRSAEYSEMYRQWLSENTGGLLDSYIADAKLNPDLVMSIVNTVYYKARWEFDRNLTTNDTFYTAGGEVEAEFMRNRLSGYYYGDRFGAVKLPFTDDSYSMWVLLPDEGVTAEELLTDPQAVELMLHGKSEDNYRQNMYVNLSLPKFDVSSDTDLIPGLRFMGVEDVFDPAGSDFRILQDDSYPIFVGSASNKSRLKIDEEGCEGASYTEMALLAGSCPPIELEEIDFVVDRPFVVAVVYTHYSEEFDRIDCLPLFAGVINNPTE